MNAIFYLSEYRRCKELENDLIEKIEKLELELDAIRSVSASDGLPHGTVTGRPTEQKAIQLADTKRDLEKMHLEATLKCYDVYVTILKVEPNNARKVLIRYYVDMMSVDEIAEEMDYSRSQCYNYKAIGEQEVQKMLGGLKWQNEI